MALGSGRLALGTLLFCIAAVSDVVDGYLHDISGAEREVKFGYDSGASGQHGPVGKGLGAPQVVYQPLRGAVKRGSGCRSLIGHFPVAPDDDADLQGARVADQPCGHDASGDR